MKDFERLSAAFFAELERKFLWMNETHDAVGRDSPVHDPSRPARPVYVVAAFWRAAMTSLNGAFGVPPMARNCTDPSGVVNRRLWPEGT